MIKETLVFVLVIFNLNYWKFSCVTLLWIIFKKKIKNLISSFFSFPFFIYIMSKVNVQVFTDFDGTLSLDGKSFLNYTKDTEN
jgi:hypothetical protein